MRQQACARALEDSDTGVTSAHDVAEGEEHRARMEPAGLGLESDLLSSPRSIAGNVLGCPVTLSPLRRLGFPAHLALSFAASASGHHDRPGARFQLRRLKAQSSLR